MFMGIIDLHPMSLDDYEHFTFSQAKKPYLEFPVTNTGDVYDGGSPGADRIVIGSIASDYSSAVFCAGRCRRIEVLLPERY